MLKISKEEKESEIRVYQLNDELAQFEELEVDPEIQLSEILDANIVLYFVDPANYRSHIWAGSQTTTRMKFIAADQAKNVRDELGHAIKISTNDEGDELMSFKVMVGLAKREDYETEQTGPSYTGKAEDDQLLVNLTRDRIIALLEKTGIPEGYTLEMVQDRKTLYGYHENYTQYLGEIIVEKKLYPIEGSVPDGPYMMEGLIPRIIMSYNKVVITEYLRKITPEELNEKERVEEKIGHFKQSQTPFTSN